MIDPYARRVTDLVVRRGRLAAEDRVIPIERVQRADDDGVQLDASAAELDRFPLFREQSFVTPAKDWVTVVRYAVTDTVFWDGAYVGVAPPARPVVEYVVPGPPESQVVVRRGTDVIYNGAVVGVLEQVLFDPTNGALTHIVVEENEHGRHVIVPAEWMRELRSNLVLLKQWEPDRPGVPEVGARRRTDAAMPGANGGEHAERNR